MYNNLIQGKSDTEYAMPSDIASLEGRLEEMTKQIVCLQADSKQLCRDRDILKMIVSGNLVFEVMDGHDIKASDLNAAAAGEARVSACVELLTDDCDLVDSISLDLVTTPGESVADADVGAPTVMNPPAALVAGRSTIHLELDTDAGATKTYAPGDSVDVTVQIASDDKLLGHTIASAIVTFNVV